MQIKIFSFFLLLFITVSLHAQNTTSNLIKQQIPVNTSKERSWWNLLHYTIAITPDLNKKFISGTNKVTFVALQTENTMQVDLKDPMQITSIIWKDLLLPYTAIRSQVGRSNSWEIYNHNIVMGSANLF